eukprot:g13572.t1
MATSPLLEKDMLNKKEEKSNQQDYFSIQTINSHNIILLLAEKEEQRRQAVYTFIEKYLGVRFELHNDVLPDRTDLPLSLYSNKSFFTTTSENIIDRYNPPMFEYRGLQPFHDFPEGPDWWDTTQWKHVITQISKMKMNFIGLHTYPYSNKSIGNVTGTNEPTTWVGTLDQLNPDGTVKESYPTSYANTLRDEWGDTSVKTSSYLYGTSEIFESDCWASYPTNKESCPYPKNMLEQNNFFERVSDMLEEAFHFGTKLNVQSCLGTETPLSKPIYTEKNEKNQNYTTQDYYEGMFTRLMKRIPSLSWYWIWTPEGWEWSKVNSSNPVFTNAIDDLAAAMAAKKKLGYNVSFSTNGWVVGPLPDRTIFDQVLPTDWDAITSIDLNTGHNPVDPAYEKIIRHNKWDIPWMEDDPTLTQSQLWVNRTLQHMDDAKKYGCNGLLGIHWRTRATSPQISAMAQKSWNPTLNSFEFWMDWVEAHFFGSTSSYRLSPLLIKTPHHHDNINSDVKDSIAGIFKSVDSFKMPILVQWVNGPGQLVPSCENITEFEFVDRLKSFRNKIIGPANLDRYDYWLNTFQYMRAIGNVQCSWKQMLDIQTKISKGKDVKTQKYLAETIGLPARIALVNNVSNMIFYLQNTISSPGELGTYMNIQSHSLNKVLNATELQKYLQAPLPTEAIPSTTFTGSEPLLIVPTARSTAEQGEAISWRALVLSSNEETCKVNVYIRDLQDSNTFLPFPMKNIGRSVFEINTKNIGKHTFDDDFAYYMEAECGEKKAYFPAGAPAIFQTVVWL